MLEPAADAVRRVRRCVFQSIERTWAERFQHPQNEWRKCPHQSFQPNAIPFLSTGAGRDMAILRGNGKYLLAMGKEMRQRRGSFRCTWTVTSFFCNAMVCRLSWRYWTPPIGTHIVEQSRPEPGQIREGRPSSIGEASKRHLLLGNGHSPKHHSNGVATISGNIVNLNLRGKRRRPGLASALGLPGTASVQGDRNPMASMKGPAGFLAGWRRALVSSRHAANGHKHR